MLMQHYLSRNVEIDRTNFLGRSALKVAYANSYKDYVDETGLSMGNAFVEVPLTNFYEDTIYVDIAAECNGKIANRDGAAGVAFRIQSGERYELVYLRTANGRLNFPPPPVERLGQAVQYASPPEWTSDRLRNQFPGRYEASAKIGVKRWNQLSITVRNNTIAVFLDGNPKPMIKQKLLGTDARGAFAYWVDAGTIAYFSNLRIIEF